MQSTIWTNDSYVIQAADVAAGYAGRGYNVGMGRWETVSGAQLSASRMSPHRLKHIVFGAGTAAGNCKDGMIGLVFVVVDPQWTSRQILLFQGMQSKGRFLEWHGDAPLGAGLCWRISQGGLLATDIVSIGVGYE
ncbi:MAG: hypothetical protein MUP14_04230 [Dehalococcoidia bacterium]|nr:hypothetical protein [Dehalococcoidia bacterium]